MNKSAEAFRTIGEVADVLDVPKHVLRFWEGKFPQIRPMKRGGGRRYYRPEDMELLRGIRHLLHAEGYTIKGVQKILREHGVDQVKAAARAAAALAAAAGQAGDRRRGRKGRLRTAEVNAPIEQPGINAAAPRKAATTPDSTEIVTRCIKELEQCRSLMLSLRPHTVAEPEEPKRQRAASP